MSSEPPRPSKPQDLVGSSSQQCFLLSGSRAVTRVRELFGQALRVPSSSPPQLPNIGTVPSFLNSHTYVLLIYRRAALITPRRCCRRAVRQAPRLLAMPVWTRLGRAEVTYPRGEPCRRCAVRGDPNKARREFFSFLLFFTRQPTYFAACHYLYDAIALA